MHASELEPLTSQLRRLHVSLWGVVWRRHRPHPWTSYLPYCALALGLHHMFSFHFQCNGADLLMLGPSCQFGYFTSWWYICLPLILCWWTSAVQHCKGHTQRAGKQPRYPHTLHNCIPGPDQLARADANCFPHAK